ncbi:MAG TPA: efflux RND transporter permease subunit [Rubricoccaceae bacterium]|nr:efflux RND transporter permease subunit [Rubricoccaceae bacterium]
MFISDFAIRRPMVTVLAMVALVVFGLFALLRLETDEFPEVEQPVLLLLVPYPGGAPEGVEQEVLEPIEEATSGLSGVDDLFGTAGDGYAQLIILFEFGKDMQEASQEVRDAISAIRQDLPAEMEEPIIRRVDPADFPVVSLVLSSDRMTPAQLTRIAEDDVTRALQSLSGVARVSVVGDQERALTVELRPDALATAGVDVGQVVQALQAQNLDAPVGRLNAPGQEQSVRLEGRLPSPEAFAAIPVGQGANGRTVTLGEVATVRDDAEEARSLALFNGRESVGIDIIKTRGASTTTVSDNIHAAIEELRPTLPEGTQIQVVTDSGERVEASVSNVQEALLEGALLTVLVVFLFLNSWRSTVITGIALPISVLAAFVAVLAAGFTLNTMSLLGLSLAIGILIDDAIVVRENIVRHIEMGKDHFRAAQVGTSEIGLAVAATTFSIIAVFVPIGFMEGVAGQWFKPFALTIACAVLVSLFVSFSLDPMLSAYWADPELEAHEKSRITRWLDRFNAWFNRQADRYRRLVGWALDRPGAVVLFALGSLIAGFALPGKGLWAALAVVAVTTAFALLLIRFRGRRWYVTLGLVLGAVVAMNMVQGIVPASDIKVGSAFFPPEDNSEFYIRVETPPGTDLATTRERVENAARIARAHPEVAYTYATIGASSGFSEGGVDVGQVYVRLKPLEEREVGAEALAMQVREEVKAIPGATAAVFTSGFGGGQKMIQLRLRGRDPEALQEAAALVMAEVRRVPGAVDVGLSTRGQKPELEVEVDRDAALARGITAAQVALAMRPAFAGIDVGDWVDPDGETRDVIIRLAPEARASAEDVAWLPIRAIGAQGPVSVPLYEVATVRDGLGPALITHFDRDPVINVEANTDGRPLSEVLAGITARLENVDLPPGVVLTQGGDVEAQQEVFGNIFAALGLGVLLMYLILVLQFGSFLDPLAILVSLPLSLIGVMLGLLVTGGTLNLMSLIGVILLAGIVAKNVILLIDFAKAAKGRGMHVREALIEAGATRLRPILMTTVALIAGMIPVAIGSGEGAMFRRPLGVTVIGGTITSTLLTLLVIPVVYELFDKMRDRVLAPVRRRRAARAHGDGHTADGKELVGAPTEAGAVPA